MDETFISINCLEYVTIIINYCASLTFFVKSKMTDDPHPLVLCITDNISAKKWTTHTCKKSFIWQVFARFFCGLLIGSDVGINAKWITTEENKIADKISRIKKSHHSKYFSFCYDFSKLKQDYAELKHCRFFHPSPELLYMLWEIMLMQKCPDLSMVQKLKQKGVKRTWQANYCYKRSLELWVLL